MSRLRVKIDGLTSEELQSRFSRLITSEELEDPDDANGPTLIGVVNGMKFSALTLNRSNSFDGHINQIESGHVIDIQFKIGVMSYVILTICVAIIGMSFFFIISKHTSLYLKCVSPILIGSFGWYLYSFMNNTDRKATIECILASFSDVKVERIM